jgi:segregation and condensation protein A
VNDIRPAKPDDVLSLRHPADPVPDDRPISIELAPELEYFRLSESYRVELDSYYGPLDLLLYLIQKDELDIYDIPIAHITEKFLQYIDVLEAMSLDNAGEFIVMAATLMRIKARLLLPIQPNEEELDEDDPRAELIRRLLEYKRFKEMAANFNKLEDERSRLHVRSQRPTHLAEQQEEPQLRLGMFDLLNALSGVFDRVSKEAVHSVARAVITVEEKVLLIRKRLAAEETIRFDELFKDDAMKMEVVVTFVAILELAKAQDIRLMQSDLNGMIWVKLHHGKPDSQGDLDETANGSAEAQQ